MLPVTGQVRPFGCGAACPLPFCVGRRDVTGVLDFLIDGVLQQLVELLHFGIDLGDVAEFDFDGCRKAVAAVLGQTELFAVIGAEFDGHNGGCMWWVAMRAQKSQTVIGLAAACFCVVLPC